jgi:hypothetical protein
LAFGVVIVRPASKKLSDLKPLVPQIPAALATLQPGQVVIIEAN